MKVKQILFGLISGVLVSGCSAVMLVSPGGKYGPTDGNTIGRIKYLAEGASSVIDSRRDDAFKKMYTACNGHYRILNDTSKDKLMGFSEYNVYSGSGFLGIQEYVYISFQCTKK